MTAFVLGGAGFLGLNVVEAMQRAQLPLICGRRKRSNVLGLLSRKVSMVEVNLDDSQGQWTLPKPCKTLVHLAGHYPRWAHRPQESLALAERQMRNVLDAAAASGIERMIYVSSTATVPKRSGRASDERDVFEQRPGLGTYHDVKWTTEQMALNERRMEVAVVCPGACLGPYDWKRGTSAMLWQLLAGEAPPHPEGMVAWVDARDVADAIVRLLGLSRWPKRLLLAGGQSEFHAFLCRIAPRYGVRTVPEALSPRAAMALADEAELQAEANRSRPQLSRELVDLIVHGASLDASLSQKVLSLKYRPLEETLAVFDGWAAQMGARLPTQERMSVHGSVG